jgi:hypothetical protein
MATKLYRTQAEICLIPQWHLDPPQIQVQLDKVVLFQDKIKDLTKIQFDQDLTPGDHQLQILFTNKTEQDTNLTLGLDKAVIIDHIVFNKIHSPKFVWQGIYRPDYPEPWFSEQKTPPAAELNYHNYLGWNGQWTLTFRAPIFTWIHQVENLGWIYS